MGTLGAVYGISFVAGSLASMGSAYMASKIYPIEESTIGEQSEINPVSVPSSTQGGMRGGATLDQINQAKAAADRVQAARTIVEASPIVVNWKSYNDAVNDFITKSRPIDRSLTNAFNSAHGKAKRNKTPANIADAKTAEDNLIEAVQAAVPAAPGPAPAAAVVPGPAPAAAVVPAPLGKVIIIGGGPVGLFAAFQLLSKDTDVKVDVLESLSQDDYLSSQQEFFIENKIFEKFPVAVKTTLKDSPNACKIFRPEKALKNYCFANLDDNDQTGYSIKIDGLLFQLKDFCTNQYRDRFNIIFDAKATLNGDVINYTDNYGNIQKIPFKNLIITTGDVTEVVPYNLFKNLPVPEIPTTYGMAINMKISDNRLPGVTNAAGVVAALTQYKNAKLQHRFRFFRQQDNDIYLGINLSKAEYDTYMTALPAIPEDGVPKGSNRNQIRYDVTDPPAIANLFTMIKTTVDAYTGKDSSTSISTYLTIPPKGIRTFSITLTYTTPGHLELPNKSHIYVAGNAAMKTHFFTSFGVNFGLESAEKVVNSIKDPKTLKDYFTFLDDSKKLMVTKTKEILIDFTRQCDAEKVARIKTAQPVLTNFRDEDVCLMDGSKVVGNVSKKISDWVDGLSKNMEISKVISEPSIREFLKKNQEISPSKFIEQYALYVEGNYNKSLKVIVPRLSPDSIQLFIKTPGMVGGGQRGGTMEDFQVFDIISGISEINSKYTPRPTSNDIKKAQNSYPTIIARATAARDNAKIASEKAIVEKNAAQAALDAAIAKEDAARSAATGSPENLVNTALDAKADAIQAVANLDAYRTTVNITNDRNARKLADETADAVAKDNLATRLAASIATTKAAQITVAVADVNVAKAIAVLAIADAARATAAADQVAAALAAANPANSALIAALDAAIVERNAAIAKGYNAAIASIKINADLHRASVIRSQTTAVANAQAQAHDADNDNPELIDAKDDSISVKVKAITEFINFVTEAERVNHGVITAREAAAKATAAADQAAAALAAANPANSALIAALDAAIVERNAAIIRQNNAIDADIQAAIDNQEFITERAADNNVKYVSDVIRSVVNYMADATQAVSDRVANIRPPITDGISAALAARSGGSGYMMGGAFGMRLRKIIENGPFVDNKTTITWTLLQKLQPYIIAFNGSSKFPENEGEFDFEVNNINKERTSKVLTVTSWLRSVPRKTNITEKNIEEIVSDTLTFKQFIDILSEMVTIDSKTRKPTIQLDKDIFKKPTNVVPPTYVFGATIKLLTSQLSNSIEINHIIKYFEGGGNLYTFFHFKNILRLLYDYRFGDVSYDKIIISLSRIISWLKTININKITNSNIESFKVDNPSVSMEVLVDTLQYLIAQKVTINKKIIRVSDFSAIETLSPTNVDNNTKIIEWLIDSTKATLPEPTDDQFKEFKKLNSTIEITPDNLKLASLFVGSVKLPGPSLLTEGTGSVIVSDVGKVLPMLEQIKKTIDERNGIIKSEAKVRKDFKQEQIKKNASEYMKGTESEREKKMMADIAQKEKLIEELNKKQKTAEEDKGLQAAASKIFEDRIRKAVQSRNLKEMEDLLKERNAELAKDYEQVKSNDNKKGDLKPPDSLKSEWSGIINKIKKMKTVEEKLIYQVEFLTNHTDMDVKPEYVSIPDMFNKLWNKFGNKGNNNSKPHGTKTCKETNGVKPCYRKNGTLSTGGGYHQTLRNHLRSRRRTYRRS